MLTPTPTFPSVRLPSQSGGLPVEVALIAQLAPGSGSAVFASTLARQQAHAAFVDELDEPSAKLAGTDFEHGESSALFSFSVGPHGHPFHRHAGHRVFTAISGSAGAQLRFSTASEEQIQAEPASFLRALHHINVPPDCLFTVRFGSHTWHQFAALDARSGHPVLFALSCHTNELGGPLSEVLRQDVLAGRATIPSLTEVLPASVQALLDQAFAQESRVPTLSLSLQAPSGSLAQRMCTLYRSRVGALCARVSAWRATSGFVRHSSTPLKVEALPTVPEGSLLQTQLQGAPIQHEDTFQVIVLGQGFTGVSASSVLAQVLDGFLKAPPLGVTGLMQLRNVLVKPLNLRTSSLGCPVSSLLSPCQSNTFAHRFPVLEQAISPRDTRAQVVLGADDKHLRFRSCVGVEVLDDSRIAITLGTRVQCTNAFGRFYMGAIDRVHRRYVTPAMLRAAVGYAWRGPSVNRLGLVSA